MDGFRRHAVSDTMVSWRVWKRRNYRLPDGIVPRIAAIPVERDLDRECSPRQEKKGCSQRGFTDTFGTAPFQKKCHRIRRITVRFRHGPPRSTGPPPAAR